MMTTYSSSSPWYNTKQNNLNLEIWQPRPIPVADDDFQYTIQPQYNYRPDLLAYDIYGNPKLWWVFTQRNIDILMDPIYDFKSGVTIALPKKSSLLSSLGLG
jgi:Base plate wedge protein 53